MGAGTTVHAGIAEKNPTRRQNTYFEVCSNSAAAASVERSIDPGRVLPSCAALG